MNPTQSDTPRTDAMESCAVPQFELLLHAQELERELQHATSELQAARDWVLNDSKTIGQLRADLARVTAERDASRILHNQDRENYQCATRAGMAIEEQLRARVVEIEASLKAEIEARNGWWDHCKVAERRVVELEKQVTAMTGNWIEESRNAAENAVLLQDAERRNAELVAALERVRDTPGSDQTAPYRLREIARDALARSESAEPAKHPDTERLDWLEGAPSERLAEVRRILWQQRNTCEATRAAIDAARKQEGSK